MRILLDTHCFLWWISEVERLNKEARRILAAGNNTLYLSAASAWEIAIKVSIGKLILPDPPGKFVPARLATQGISALPINHIHALHVETLPLFHKDPFDRMLVAQAQLEGLPLLTADRKLLSYEVKIIWAASRPMPLASPGPRRSGPPRSRIRRRQRTR